MQQGSKGDGVKILQQKLNKVLKINLTIDGDFGAKTKDAVIIFQHKAKLTPDGVVGTKTLTALNNYFYRVKEQDKSKLKLLCIHCSATPEGMDVTKRHIEQWHLKERGWSRVGYSDLVKLDGDLVNLIPFNQDDKVDKWELSNGAKGINGYTRHICYAGGSDKSGKPKDTRTDLQKYTLVIYVRYMILRHPDIMVCGHYHFANKACPSFNVEEWLEEIGVDEKNIYREGKQL